MPLSRREFALSLATASAILPSSAAAEAQQNPPDKPDPLRLEAALWVESIRLRYPSSHFTPEVLTLVAGDVIGDILHTRRISSFPLKNADAPAFGPVSWRKRD